jgi:hypothetical protein
MLPSVKKISAGPKACRKGDETDLAADFRFARFDDRDVGVVRHRLEAQRVTSGHTIGAIGVTLVQPIDQSCLSYSPIIGQDLA